MRTSKTGSDFFQESYPNLPLELSLVTIGKRREDGRTPSSRSIYVYSSNCSSYVSIPNLCNAESQRLRASLAAGSVRQTTS